MTISAAHLEELKRIYEAIDNSWSLLTLDDLLTRATNIAEEYDEEPAKNPLLSNLRQTRRKQFKAANTEKKKERRDSLIADLKSNFRQDLTPYIH